MSNFNNKLDRVLREFDDEYDELDDEDEFEPEEEESWSAILFNKSLGVGVSISTHGTLAFYGPDYSVIASEYDRGLSADDDQTYLAVLKLVRDHIKAEPTQYNQEDDVRRFVRAALDDELNGESLPAGWSVLE